MIRGACLDHGNGLAHLAVCFEKAQQHHGVGQVADIHIRAQVAHDAMLAQDHHGGHALLVQVGQQFVHLQGQELLARHGLQVGVQAVDHDELCCAR